MNTNTNDVTKILLSAERTALAVYENVDTTFWPRLPLSAQLVQRAGPRLFVMPNDAKMHHVLRQLMANRASVNRVGACWFVTLAGLQCIFSYGQKQERELEPGEPYVIETYPIYYNRETKKYQTAQAAQWPLIGNSPALTLASEEARTAALALLALGEWEPGDTDAGLYPGQECLERNLDPWTTLVMWPDGTIDVVEE